MAPWFYEEDLLMLIPMLLSSIPSTLFGIAAYVLTSWALYTIAVRRGLNNPWLSWIPVVNCWILGSLSDQYQYVVKGKNKSKRKILLSLSILTIVFCVTMIVLAIVLVVGAVSSNSEAALVSGIMGPAIGILGVCLPMVGVSIAYTVIRFMALYDVYRSLEPGNAVLFLVLSIFFSITEPFFLFFNRNKDGGMPPRKQQEPVYTPHQDYEYETVEQYNHQPQEPAREPWEQENKNYL